MLNFHRINSSENTVMRKLILLFASLFTMVLQISASPVRAQQWVSPTGSDANACTTTAPCATFQRAINVGASQINCLGSGSYGPVTITTSLTIDCGAGNVGNVIVSGGSNFAITITGSGITVILRHLALNGLGTAAAGIVATIGFTGRTLIVEDCMVHGFAGSGIAFAPSNARGLLQVSNSQIFQNATGIAVAPINNNIASTTLSRVELVANSQNGLSLTGDGVVAGTMRDSIVGENAGNGIVANTSQVFFTVEQSSIIANLANGINVTSSGSNLTVTASTIGANGTGVKATAGSIVSFGNNSLNGNGSDGAFTSTISLK
jgi:hypothetical protein